MGKMDGSIHLAAQKKIIYFNSTQGLLEKNLLKF